MTLGGRRGARRRAATTTPIRRAAASTTVVVRRSARSRVARGRVRRGATRVPRELADAGSGRGRDERDRRGRAAGRRAHREDLEHPDRRPRLRSARQPPGDRAPARGVAGCVHGVAAVVLRDVIGDSIAICSTRAARAADRRRARSRGSIPRDIAAVAADGARATDRRPARCGSPARRRSTAAELAARTRRARSRSRCPARLAKWRDAVCWRPAWIRGSPTRPCTSTKPSRAARSATCRTTSNACSAGRRADRRVAARRARAPVTAERVTRAERAADHRPVRRRDRSASCSARPATRDRRSRANAAHASRIARRQRVRRVVGADELVPAVDEVAERERDVDAVARAEPRSGRPT